MLSARHLSFTKTTFSDGFWKTRQDINKSNTAYAVYNRFKDTGRFDAISCKWKEGEPNKPHEYWDSDVAKWIEGVAYILTQGENAELESIVDKTVDEIEKNMLPCGYFNSFYINLGAEERFTNRNNHELYCLGHLIEAGIAYKHATGKDKLLNLVIKYADYVKKIFIDEKSAKFSTPGHQEIELALFKLYKETGDRKYLDMASYFIENRGKCDESLNEPEFQSHKPVREQTEAVGHCVRALYMYSAMADLAGEMDDEELLSVCKKLWDDITKGKMYITGGVGSDSYGERFTHKYDLPNAIAYTETCAAISLMMFAHRMSEIEINSEYADIIERVMYNGMLSGVSLDGRKFFYTNPLETDPRLLKRYDIYKEKPTYQPIQQRVEVFDCSCCPPNILRVIASIGDYFYSESGDTVYVNQFGAGTMRNGKMTVVQETDYPFDGNVKLTVSGCGKRLAVRIPNWCEKFRISKPYELENGYAYIEDADGETDISFEMPTVLIEANPNITEDGARAAVMRGPVVFCAEEPAGANLKDMQIPLDAHFEEGFSEELKVPVVRTKLLKKEKFSGLYRRAQKRTETVETELIPYFAFANRGERGMLVWINL